MSMKWCSPYSLVEYTLLTPIILKNLKDVMVLSPFRKRTMFQKIVESVEVLPDEKEKVNYISNNATRKEIIM